MGERLGFMYIYGVALFHYGLLCSNNLEKKGALRQAADILSKVGALREIQEIQSDSELRKFSM